MIFCGCMPNAPMAKNMADRKPSEAPIMLRNAARSIKPSNVLVNGGPLRTVVAAQRFRPVRST